MQGKSLSGIRLFLKLLFYAICSAVTRSEESWTNCSLHGAIQSVPGNPPELRNPGGNNLKG